MALRSDSIPLAAHRDSYLLGYRCFFPRQEIFKALPIIAFPKRCIGSHHTLVCGSITLFCTNYFDGGLEKFCSQTNLEQNVYLQFSYLQIRPFNPKSKSWRLVISFTSPGCRFKGIFKDLTLIGLPDSS